jgi:hypothetical protein
MTTAECFVVKRSLQNLNFMDYGGYETRNESTQRLIRDAVSSYDVPDFDPILVHTGDRPLQKAGISIPVLNYSSNDNLDCCCPDFVFDHWRQTGLEDYEETRIKLLAFEGRPLQNKLGWRGADTHPSRRTLVSNFQSKRFDVQFVVWDRSDPDNLKAKNFMSFEQQISEWRFIIDVEGNGYSGRLKLLLASNRVLFLQDRPYKEFFFKDLEPWIHFVPVKRDLSDLEEKLDLVSRDEQLEKSIIRNAREFSTTRLSRSAAVKKWAEILTKFKR